MENEQEPSTSPAPTPTTTLILGASGMTGRRLVEQLLADKQNVRAVVRSKEGFKEIIPDNEQLKVIESTGENFSSEKLHFSAPLKKRTKFDLSWLFR